MNKQKVGTVPFRVNSYSRTVPPPKKGDEEDTGIGICRLAFSMKTGKFSDNFYGREKHGFVSVSNKINLGKYIFPLLSLS